MVYLRHSNPCHGHHHHHRRHYHGGGSGGALRTAAALTGLAAATIAATAPRPRVVYVDPIVPFAPARPIYRVAPPAYHANPVVISNGRPCSPARVAAIAAIVLGIALAIGLGALSAPLSLIGAAIAIAGVVALLCIRDSERLIQ